MNRATALCANVDQYYQLNQGGAFVQVVSCNGTALLFQTDTGFTFQTGPHFSGRVKPFGNISVRSNIANDDVVINVGSVEEWGVDPSILNLQVSPPLDVNVQNFPAVQVVSVNNFPAGFNVNNFPTIQRVSDQSLLISGTIGATGTQDFQFLEAFTPPVTRSILGKYYSLTVRDNANVASWNVELILYVTDLSGPTFLTHSDVSPGSNVPAFQTDSIPRMAVGCIVNCTALNLNGGGPLAFSVCVGV